MLNISEIRNQFPILSQKVNGKNLIYFDNAASNQKPERVINALVKYYTTFNSNIHRGVHYLSQQATNAFEESREETRNFINAAYAHEIIFTKGTTESINLLARTFSARYLNKGDSVLISAMEHHSNIIPWQMVCAEKQCNLKIIPIDENGNIIYSELEKLLDESCKIVAVTHISNALGTVNDIQNIIRLAHHKNIPVMIDAAQSAAHHKIDVKQLDCDFLCFSSHKMYGPMGVGILYGKEDWLEKLPPYQGGGEMIEKVSFERFTVNELPFKFEAGTPNVADVFAFCEAIKFISETGIDAIAHYEQQLLSYARSRLMEIDGIRIIGNADKTASLVSFLLGNIHSYDTGVLLDKLGIAVRTGHHCAQPLMDFYHIAGTVRASFAVYNTTEEIDLFIESLLKIKTMFE